MKDYLGREIKVGDWVLVSKHERTSVHLFDGIVKSTTKASIVVGCDGGRAGYRPGRDRRVLSGDNCVILNGQEDHRNNK